MNRLYLIFVSIFLATSINGAKVHTTPAVITQRDGTKVTVYAYGDEHNVWYTTSDGVLLWHEGFDYYVAITDKEGNLHPTKQLAHEVSLRSSAENEIVRKQNRKLFYENNKILRLDAMRHEPVEGNTTLFPHTGSPRAIVILAEFADSTFKDADPKSVFEQYLNAKEIDNTVGNGTVGKNYGSVRKYFEDMSFGQFKPEFDVYGPVKLSQSLKYYGEGNRDHMERLLPEVCQLAQDQIDFSQYDQNNDGYIDLIYVICAGYSQSWLQNSSDCIWPKSGAFNFGTYNGKKAYRYGVHTELNGYPGAFAKQGLEYGINGIGLFCHEFSHCMGLPDFYPVSADAQAACNPGMEYWDLMDGGEYLKNGYSPTEYNAWEREAMGWFTIDNLSTDDKGSIALGNINNGGKAYRIKNDADMSGNEYIILQYIEKKGWNKPLFGHGMLVTHVDYDRTAFSLSSNSVNNEVGHPRYTIIPADGEYISSYDGTRTKEEYKNSMKGDPYPSYGFSEICSIPWYTGDDNGRSILNIKEYTSAPVDKLTFDYIVPNDTITPVEEFEVDSIFINGKPEGSITVNNASITSYANGDKVIEAKNFSNAEIMLSNELDISVNGFLHIDLFAYKNIQINVSLVNNKNVLANGSVHENATHVSNLNGKEWTRLDIPVKELTGGTTGNEKIEGIRLSGGNRESLYVNNIYFLNKATNSINGIHGNSCNGNTIYTMEGIRIYSPIENLRRGIYIINGKKHVVR